MERDPRYFRDLLDRELERLGKRMGEKLKAAFENLDHAVSADGSAVTVGPGGIRDGGIVKKPTRASLGRGDIQERVIPLSTMSSPPHPNPGASSADILAMIFGDAGVAVPVTPELVAQITKAVFADETSLGEFANSLSSTEAAALYQLLNARGCRFDPRALSTWRKEKRDG